MPRAPSALVLVSCFFYGSYMDPDVLRKFGARPNDPVRASLPGWRLTFTPHANLVRSDSQTAEGVVYQLPHDQIEQLYGPDGYVTTYKPVPVLVEIGGRKAVAMTFVEMAKEGAPDGAYLESFLGICARMGLPERYLEQVKGQAARLVHGTLA